VWGIGTPGLGSTSTSVVREQLPRDHVTDAPDMNDDDLTPYELELRTSEQDTSLRPLGRYRTYEDALRARNEDVLRELAARGGWYTLI
jgi:hypothetical protein